MTSLSTTDYLSFVQCLLFIYLFDFGVYVLKAVEIKPLGRVHLDRDQLIGRHKYTQTDIYTTINIFLKKIKEKKLEIEKKGDGCFTNIPPPPPPPLDLKKYYCVYVVYALRFVRNFKKMLIIFNSSCFSQRLSVVLERSTMYK